MSQNILIQNGAKAGYPNSKLLQQLFISDKNPFKAVFSQPSNFRLQIIYTQINRNAQQKPSFSHHFFNVSDGYTYPASTVKLPTAVLALEKINKLSLPGLNAHSAMVTEAIRPNEIPVYNDPSSANGAPSVAHYIKKILLVSDNDAFNRLYEFLGQQQLNQRLHALGLTQTQILHRLSISLSETENRSTNPIHFLSDAGQNLYSQPTQFSLWPYATRNDKIGKGYMKSGTLVEEPLDFSKKNRWPLSHIHQFLQWVMFPESQPKGNILQLTDQDYGFLWKFMGMQPQESNYPAYDSAYWPAYVKFLKLGSQKGAWPSADLRIFNKVGDAYGFLLDGAYFADKANNVEFLLSAVVYCNSDGILNDDNYDYDSLGFPLLKHIGEVIYQYELKRPKKHLPDLSKYFNKK